MRSGRGPTSRPQRDSMKRRSHDQGPSVWHGSRSEGGGWQVRVQGRDLLLLRARLREGVRRESGEVRGGRLMPAESQLLASLRRERWLLAAVLALALGAALLAAACGGGSSGKAIRITPGGAGATLEMTVGDNFYKPKEVR